MISAMGLDLDSFFTPLGMYSFLNSFVLLAGAVQAMHLGITIFAKERLQNSGDFLFSKPHGRVKVFWEKALAALCSSGLIGASYFAASWLALSLTAGGSFDRTAFALIAASFILVQLVFLALGVLVAMVFPRVRSALPVSAAAAFGAYVIGVFSRVVGSDLARCFSPFKYFEPSFIMAYGRFEMGYGLLFGAILLLFAVLSLRIFQKADL